MSTFWAAGWPPLSMLFSCTYDDEAVDRLMANSHLVTVNHLRRDPLRDQAFPEMQGRPRETTKNKRTHTNNVETKHQFSAKSHFPYCLLIEKEPSKSTDKNDPFCTTTNNSFFGFLTQNGGHYVAPGSSQKKQRGPQNRGHYVAPSFFGVVRPHVPFWPARLGHAAPNMSGNRPCRHLV